MRAKLILEDDQTTSSITVKEIDFQINRISLDLG